MSTTKTASDTPFATKLSQSIRSVAKILLQSRHATVATSHRDRPIIVMGNGPSLSQTIEQYSDLLRSTDSMAVNFAANAEEFTQLKPKYYILADPHFFTNREDVNVARLYDNLSKVDWPMTLLLPTATRHNTPAIDNSNITIQYYNAVGAEGFRWLTDIAYKSKRAMPRPRNVLIPAIMTSIQMGYKEIYVVGADHSWTKTLSVDNDNNVVSIQPHFYKEDTREIQRIRKEYLNHPLHSVLQSMVLAFRAYHLIDDYARRHSISIVNATPESFIDAFTRGSLDAINK